MSLFRHPHGEHYQSRRTHMLFERRENAMPASPDWERLNDDEKLISPIEKRPVDHTITYEPLVLHCSICETIKTHIQ